MNDIDPSVFEDYLHDLGVLVREMAMEAKAKAVDGGRNDFVTGYMAAFHRIVSLMQQQAETFNLPLEKISLEGLDPDEELV
jgi:hypothetical protein